MNRFIPRDERNPLLYTGLDTYAYICMNTPVYLHVAEFHAGFSTMGSFSICHDCVRTSPRERMFTEQGKCEGKCNLKMCRDKGYLEMRKFHALPDIHSVYLQF